MTSKQIVGRSNMTFGVAFAALAAFLLPARAETVAYWPLAYDNNVRTTTATAFDSIAGAGLTAYPCSLDDGAIIPGSDYCPVGTNAFPAGYGVYDPVGNVVRNAGTGLYFKTLTSNAGGYSGMLSVNNPTSLELKTFTVECFVRRQAETPRNNSWNCVAVMPRMLMNGDKKVVNCDAWGLRILKNGGSPDFGNISVRFSPETLTFNEDGTQVTERTAVFSGTCENLNDGNWHHIAFSVDDSTHTVKVYFDYQLMNTATLGFSVTYGEGENLYLGATPQTAGAFGGSLAHFRISNEVLTPDKFLQFARNEAAATEDDDVLLHVNFNPVEGLSTNGIAFNEAAKGSAVLRMTSTSSAAKILLDDPPAENVRNSLTDSQATVNSGCMTNAYAQQATDYYQWFPGEDVFTNSSFTIECFYKTTGSQNYRSLIRRRGDSATQFMLGMNGTKLRAAVWQSVTADDSEASNDGAWHHGAAVYDRVQNRILLFKDYRLAGAVAYQTHPPSLSNPLCIGGLDGTAGTRPSFGGQIDEVRVTQRALTPGEFLTSDHFDSTSKTLGWVSFDNTLDSSMSSHALSNGVASAAAEDGMAPWYESFGNGEIFRFSDSSRTILRRGDYASLACQTSSVLWASNPLLPLFADKTIEFFIKADSSKNVHDGAILRYGNGFSANLSDSEIPSMYMAFHSGSSLKLRCGILKDTGVVYQTSTDENGINNDTGVVLADGRWHHVAVTIKHTIENEANYVAVSVYKDYAATPDWTKKVAGRLYEAGESIVVIGASSSAKYFNGLINELRISQGALTPDEFLQRWTTGLTLFVR